MRRGAHDLGLDITWNYEFVSPGTTLGTRHDTVVVDVGNRLLPGVLDTHGTTQANTSSTQQVIDHPEFVYDHLLRPWLDRVDAGQDVNGRPWSPVLTTHRTPDADAICATLLAKLLVENGTLPRWAAGLAELVTMIDNGMWNPLDNGENGLRCVLNAAYVVGDFYDSDAAAMTFLHRLILAEADHLWRATEAKWGMPASTWYGDDAGHWHTCGTHAAQLAKAIASDRARYDALTDQQLTFETIQLPVASTDRTTSVNVRCAFAEDHLADVRLLKHWVRARTPTGGPGAVASMIRMKNPSGSTSASRVIVALDPTQIQHLPPERRPSLRSFGAHLEMLEVRKRKQLGKPRGGYPRWPDVTNSDPWYDGRDKDYTIVDGPKSGSILSVTEIKNALNSEFWRSFITGEVTVWSASPIDGASEGKNDELTLPASHLLTNSAMELLRALRCNPDLSTSPETKRPAITELFGGQHTDSPASLCLAGHDAFTLQQYTFAIRDQPDDEMARTLHTLREQSQSLYLFVCITRVTSASSADDQTSSPPDEDLMNSLMHAFTGVSRQDSLRWSRAGVAATSRTVVCLEGIEGVHTHGLKLTQLHTAMCHGLLHHLLNDAERDERLNKRALHERVGILNRLITRLLTNEVSEHPVLQGVAMFQHQQLGMRDLTNAARTELNHLDNRISDLRKSQLEFILGFLGLLSLVSAGADWEGATQAVWYIRDVLIFIFMLALVQFGLRFYERRVGQTLGSTITDWLDRR